MNLSDTRYIRIEGTSVALELSTDDEAKVALKELRHKKREYQHVKRKIRSAELDADIDVVNEILLYLEEAILYVQGKLIARGVD